MRKYKLALAATVIFVVAVAIKHKIESEEDLMVDFISGKIKEAKAVSLEKGQDKYRAYFVKKNAARLYGKYQADVDTILETDGCEDCIVR